MKRVRALVPLLVPGMVVNTAWADSLGLGTREDAIASWFERLYPNSVVLTAWLGLAGIIILCWLALHGVRFIQHQRRAWLLSRRICPSCRYDLRGAEHARCPECGVAMSDAA